MEIASIVFLAIFLEGLLTYLFKKDGEDQAPKPWIKYIALLAGIGLAIGYQVDIPAMIGLPVQFVLLNYIVSGIIIGRGSNYVNDVMSFFQKKSVQ